MQNAYVVLWSVIIVLYVVSSLFCLIRKEYRLGGYVFHTFGWYCVGSLIVYLFGNVTFAFSNVKLQLFIGKLATVPFYTLLKKGYQYGTVSKVSALFINTFVFSLGVSLALVILHAAGEKKWTKIYRVTILYSVIMFVMFAISNAYFEWGIFIIVLITPLMANFIWANMPEKVTEKLESCILKEGGKEHDYFEN